MNLFESLQIMAESDNVSSETNSRINEINSSFKSIRDNITKYREMMGTITDSKGYDFSYKLYDLMSAMVDDKDEYEDDADFNAEFELTATDIYNRWEEECEAEFNRDYRDIFKHDNNNGSYFSFNTYYIYIALLSNELSNNYSNADIFLLLNDEDKIGPYYEDYVINSLENNNGIDVNILKDADPDYWEDIIGDIYRDMTEVAKQIQSEVESVDKLVTLYHDLKEG